MTPEEAKLIAQQYADVVEAKGKELRAKIGARAFYAGIGAVSALVVDFLVRSLL